MASTGFRTAFRHLRGLFEGGSVLTLEDGQLLARYRSGRDEVAFEALVTRHGPMVLTICRAVLRNEHDVEDAFQATFLVLARKAGSIRETDALGGWLHRVAYRASVQASVEAVRRRRIEAESREVARSVGPRTDPELDAILHEEIDRLPEGQRLPVVLCDLEGLTYEQAARQLDWSVPTLRNRLARGRQRLKARLTRRGLLVPAVGACLASNASAAVPDALTRMAVLSATGGTASSGAVLLTHTLLRGMLMTKLKIASAAALAALALVSAGAIAAGAGRPDDPKPAMKPAARSEVAIKATPAAEKSTGDVEVRGLVVGPDSKPVSGARVRAQVNAATTPEATSGPDGRFRLRIPPHDPTNGRVREDYPWLVASAPGFGLGWVKKAFEPGPSGESTIRLHEDGPPIEGRVMDLEGRPVAGASVKAGTVWFSENGGFDAWLAKVRDQQIQTPSQGGLVGLPTPIEGTTGPDGRFRLTGLGRDGVALLSISGPTLASSVAQVILREGVEIRGTPTPPPRMLAVRAGVFHAPKFEFVLAPTKPIEGVIRDKDTGQPIAGLNLQARVLDNQGAYWEPDVVARTDDRGRYRLLGLPKATAYRLSVYPFSNAKLPYPDSTWKVPGNAPGLEPISFDIPLKRGVVLRGRVTDKATGRPVAGYVHAYTFRDNPNLANFPGFIEGHWVQAYLDSEGRYQIITVPGRNILACRSDIGQYRGNVGAEAIAGFDRTIPGFQTVPYMIHNGNYHTLGEIVLDPKDESATFDLQVDPGRTLTVTTLDPEGRPIGGTVAKGVGDLFQSTIYPQESPTFEVHALDPSKPRRVTVTHEARKLVGTAFLKGDESGPITIKLQPWGSVAGRIVDDEGRPRKGLGLSSVGGSQPKDPETRGILPNGDWHNGILLGADGKLRVEGLVPGLKYGATVLEGNMLIGEAFDGLIIAPGESKDLGDLKVQPPNRRGE